MSDPVVELELATETQMDEEESVHEYVTRIGEEAGVDQETAARAAEYATEWHYGSDRPVDDRPFETFLTEVRSAELLSTDLDERKAPADTDVSIDVSGPGAGSRSEPTRGEPEADDGPPPDSAPSVERDRSEPSTTDGSETALHPSFKSGLQGREVQLLLLRFLAIAFTAPLLGWMMGRAWVPGNVVYDQVETQLAGLLGIPPTQALQFGAAFGFGLFLALLILFTIDPKKRVQGALLILGSVLSIGVLSTMGIFLPNMDFGAPLALLGLGLGLAVGFITEIEQLYALDPGRSSIRRLSLADGRVAEFRTAARGLFVLVTLVVVLTLAQVVIADAVRLPDVFAAGVFLVLSYQFIQYESETSYTTLGPARSGKSTMMLALCLELLMNSETNPNPNSYLASALERTSNIRQGEERWPLPSTPHDEARVSSFEVIAGTLFPRRLELTALDYAGQHLGRVADYLEGEEDTDEDSTAATIADWIGRSDRLLFILDVERLVFPETFQDGKASGESGGAFLSWGLEEYATIIEETAPEDVIVVATKCDILIDQDLVPPPADVPPQAAFTRAVTEHLATRPDVERLLELTGEEEILPVYIETMRRDGEYVPELDEAGNLQPVGFDQLIAEIRTRQ